MKTRKSGLSVLLRTVALACLLVGGTLLAPRFAPADTVSAMAEPASVPSFLLVSTTGAMSPSPFPDFRSWFPTIRA